jgi:hypothetical protein
VVIRPFNFSKAPCCGARLTSLSWPLAGGHPLELLININININIIYALSTKRIVHSTAVYMNSRVTFCNATGKPRCALHYNVRFAEGMAHVSGNADTCPIIQDGQVKHVPLPEGLRRRFAQVGATRPAQGASADVGTASESQIPQTSIYERVRSFISTYSLILWILGFATAIIVIGRVFSHQIASGLVMIGMGYLMYVNLGDRRAGELSAYSVFNPNYERLPGQLTGAQFEAEIRHMPLNAVQDEQDRIEADRNRAQEEDEDA